MDRYSRFKPKTKISRSDFAELEKLAGLKFTDRQREAILAHLREFEFFRTYEKDGVGRRRWEAFKEISMHLEAIISAAKAEEELPGHLWSFVTFRAGMNNDAEIARLERLREEFQALAHEVQEARRHHREADPWLAELLFALEKEFLLAGAKKTGVARGAEQKRHGKFVQFCDAALKHLPPDCKPKVSIGSRWETLYNGRKKGLHPPARNWVGKANPGLKHY